MKKAVCLNREVFLMRKIESITGSTNPSNIAAIHQGSHSALPQRSGPIFFVHKMENEQKAHISVSNPQSLTQQEEDDGRPPPQTSPEFGSPLSSSPSESIQDLEKKFGAFARNHVYGTMRRGELPLGEKLLLGLALVTLVPLRVVSSIAMLLFYYLICCVCTMFSTPNREDDQEDYAHIGGWRRSL